MHLTKCTGNALVVSGCRGGMLVNIELHLFCRFRLHSVELFQRWVPETSETSSIFLSNLLIKLELIPRPFPPALNSRLSRASTALHASLPSKRNLMLLYLLAPHLLPSM